MKYGIKFTAAEMEALNNSLNAASIYFDNRAKASEIEPWVTDACKKFRDEARDLWMRIYAAQKVAGLRNRGNADA